MFRNYIRTALRNMWRNRLFTGLNIAGLSTGLACSILIFLWVQDELSYDKFNPGSDKIFRLTARAKDIESAQVPMGFTTILNSEIPGVKSATRVIPDAKIIEIGIRKFDEKQVLDVDSNFLHIFNYPLLIGDASTVLRTPNGAILTAATAIKYFGSPEAAMGKPIFDLNDSFSLQVTGILKDIPTNSHLRFRLLLPMQNASGQAAPTLDWRHFDSYVYFQLEGKEKPEPAVLHRLEKQLMAIREKAIINTKAVSATVSIQSLEDIHLHSHFRGDVEGQGNSEYVKIFTLVGVFILIIACINFMNLATAMSSARSKEVGLRKTIGALRSQLTLQFIGESMLLTFVSLLLALLLAYLALPFFNDLASKSVSLNLFDVALVGKLLIIALVVGLLAGSYPAFYMSSFNVVTVLKGGQIQSGKSSFLRDATVVFQFSIAVILIVSTVVVYEQLRYLHNRDIGFNRSNLLYVPMPDVGDRGHNADALRSSLSRSPQISDYTVVSDLPTNLTTGRQLTWRGMESGTTVISQWMGVDENFTKTFGIRMLAGNYYSGEFKVGDSEYVVNETALKIMHMSVATAVGRRVALDGREGAIIGVVKDFNFKPVYQPVEPLILRRRSVGDFLVVRTPDGPGGEQTMAAVQDCFRQAYGNTPFSYGFVDQDLDHLYAAETRMGSLFKIFSVLSVAISCLGLFGLATFATQRRTKEIGIRKVLGAGEAHIVFLLAKEFLILVIVSLSIAFPISWYAMRQWLQQFVYRVNISGWVFAAAGALALFIAFVTVSYHTIKAALSNPVQSLRSDPKG